MKKRSFFTILAVSVLSVLSLSAAALAQNKPDVAGRWEGAITLPNGELQFMIDLSRKDKDKGDWSGTIDIPAQGAKGLPLDAVKVDGAAVSFAIANIPGDPAFKGKLSDDGKTVAGDFTQGGQTFPFKITKKP